MFTLFLLLQCSSMLYSIGVQEEIRGKSIDEQNTLGKLDPIANLSDNRLENTRANGEEEHINVAPGARAGVDHDLILQEVVLCRAIYCCFFDSGYFWYLVGCLYGISIVNSAQSIIVVIGIFDQVIAFGLHQSQHLVEVREKALFEVRSHLNNSNN